MTQASPTQTAQVLSNHLREFAQFLEVKAQVLEKLEALEREGRILEFLTQDQSPTTLIVRMFVPSSVSRADRGELMWEVSDLGLNTEILVDAFVRVMYEEPNGVQDVA
jgi:hypothetical protein